MSNPDRILTSRRVKAMVAADTFHLLVERITPMLRSGRRMALALREATYLNRPPVVRAGLRLDVDAPSGGVWVNRDARHALCGIVLTTGGDSYQDQIGVRFGAAIHLDSGNATEEQAWLRYRGATKSASYSERRRDMTRVDVVGGLPGADYDHEDSIIGTSWSGDGVATEWVIGFEVESGTW